MTDAAQWPGADPGAVADCLFCKIAAGSIPADKLHDDDLVVAFRDIAPRAPTHILLVSRRHIAVTPSGHVFVGAHSRSPTRE